MASNFIPMLSSSPPPIEDDCLENDDDEDNDFGAFKSVKDVFVNSSVYNSNDLIDSTAKYQPSAINNVHSENGLDVPLSVLSSHSLDPVDCKELENSNRTHSFCSHTCDSNISCKLPSLNKNLCNIDEVECEIDGISSNRSICLTENSSEYDESWKPLSSLTDSKADLLNSQDICKKCTSHSEHNSTSKIIVNSNEGSLNDIEPCEKGKENKQFSSSCESFSHNILLKQQTVNTEQSNISKYTSAINGEQVLSASCEKNADIEALELVNQELVTKKALKTNNFSNSISEKFNADDKIIDKSSHSLHEKANIMKVCDICFRNLSTSDQNILCSSKALSDDNSLHKSDSIRCNCTTLITENLNKESSSNDVENVLKLRKNLVVNIDEIYLNTSTASQNKVSNFVGEDIAETETSVKNPDATIQHDGNSLPDEFDDFQQAEILSQIPEHGNDFDGDLSKTMYDRWKECSEGDGDEFNDFNESFVSFPCEHDPCVEEGFNVISCLSGTSASVSGESIAQHFPADDFGDSKHTIANEDIHCDREDIPKSQAVENFADFDAADFVSVSENIVSMKEAVMQPTTKESERGIEKISKVISAIYPAENCTDSDLEKKDVEIWEHSPKSHRLWDKLQEVEQTPGLRFQWGISHSFQMLLRSVNIDYHSILRTSSIPLFASGLSILEPTKGTTSSTTKLEDEGAIQSPKDPIPPVHFDWGSSGLVNPLDSNHVTSTLMDLSFLSSSDAVSSQSSASVDLGFENELFTCSSSVSNELNVKPPILEQLLLSTAPSSLPDTHQFHRPSNISEEASHVLDQLPDLSFMRAKVLMFPISNVT